MSFIAGEINLVTDQYREFTRAWQLRVGSKDGPLYDDLDVDTAKLLATDGTGNMVYNIDLDYDPTLATFTLDATGTTMTTAGNFAVDVVVTPSTGAAHEFSILKGTLTVRPGIPVPA